jgi:CheY-like chemotaxis protein
LAAFGSTWIRAKYIFVARTTVLHERHLNDCKSRQASAACIQISRVAHDLLSSIFNGRLATRLDTKTDAPAHTTRTPTVRASRGPLVLVVDDDRDARTIYREYLRAMGCRVVTARDGCAAIDQATLHRPDLIVMDMAMPHMDGWTATRHLRRRNSTRHVPIIALTAVPSARDTAREAGCDAFLAKPCLPELLWWEVQALLRPPHF